MHMHEIFLVAADGTVSLSEWEPDPEPQRESRLPAIVEKLGDPQFSAAELQHLILEEKVLVVEEMRKYERRPDGAPKVRYGAQLLKALDTLGKQLQRSDATRNHDGLNLDGPQFRFVFGELIDQFKEAARAALGKNSDTMVQSIMKHWRDLFIASEASIRSELKKIGNGKDEVPPAGPMSMTFNR